MTGIDGQTHIDTVNVKTVYPLIYNLLGYNYNKEKTQNVYYYFFLFML